ncbi:MAG TPA: ribosome maturation factor RimP [Casimicrobiaceae bacterium]|nr:ribosome maturation factor RimP [Casimicrobiaceae bacterium]
MNLVALLERTLGSLGVELVDVELSPKGRQIRVSIDKPNGVDVEDCARVSSHLTRVFAVENVDYERLEVSSPGLDRPLKKAADFARFAGQDVKLTLREPIDGARKWKGRLRTLEATPRGDEVVVDTDKGEIKVLVEDIERARLVPRIEWR